MPVKEHQKMQTEYGLALKAHGGDIYRNSHVMVDFSVNVNPLGPQPEVTAAVCASAAQIANYPDIYCERLAGVLGGYEDVPPKFLIFGNGAAELIFSAVQAVKPKRALLLSPTFSEYERALKAVDAQLSYYELKEEEQFRVKEDILAHIEPGIGMVFLCNPNNPTGQCVLGSLMDRIAKRCAECKSFLVIDECFVDFLDAPEMYGMKDRLCMYPNMVIVKAFTKLFCMPGLRLGYAMCSSRDVLCRMREAMQTWNVSVTAQAAGIAAIENCGSYVAETKRLIRQERDYLLGELEKLGYKVYGSKANYIFFKDIRPEERNLYDEALNAGFLFRDCSDYRGLERGYYRIAVRTRADNERMVAWLRQL